MQDCLLMILSFNVGLVPQKHKSKGRARTIGKVVPPNGIERVVEFIKAYGEQHGMLLSG